MNAETLEAIARRIGASRIEPAQASEPNNVAFLVHGVLSDPQHVEFAAGSEDPQQGYWQERALLAAFGRNSP